MSQYYKRGKEKEEGREREREREREGGREGGRVGRGEGERVSENMCTYMTGACICGEAEVVQML